MISNSTNLTQKKPTKFDNGNPGPGWRQPQLFFNLKMIMHTH